MIQAGLHFTLSTASATEERPGYYHNVQWGCRHVNVLLCRKSAMTQDALSQAYSPRYRNRVVRSPRGLESPEIPKVCTFLHRPRATERGRAALADRCAGTRCLLPCMMEIPAELHRASPVWRTCCQGGWSGPGECLTCGPFAKDLPDMDFSDAHLA